MEQVILVNERDEELGAMEKMQAHEKAILHRAFSVFIFNSRGEMLLQRRALKKYHSGGLWTNACCSHPRPGEHISVAAVRRLKEELGFTTQLDKIFEFTYRAVFENGLTEYEFDHVFTGYHDGVVNPDKKEVSEYVFKSLEQISHELQVQPEIYTAWFHLAFYKVADWLRQQRA